MNFSDEGYIIHLRRHGENALIVTLLSHGHGKVTGYVQGALSKKKLGIFQLGNALSFNAYARLEENMPSLRGVELVKAHAANFMQSSEKLAVLESFCALFDACIPEKEPLEFLTDSIECFFSALDQPDWLTKYALAEFHLLDFLGIGLDLSCCAATGTRENLAFVSPKSGKAVCLDAGLPYADKLFRFPYAVVDKNYAPSLSEVADLLKLTGYFLNKNFFQIHNLQFPNNRATLLEQLNLMHIEGK